jgi:hypothetical protein
MKKVILLLAIGLLGCKTAYQDMVSDENKEYFKYKKIKGSNSDLKYFRDGGYLLSAFRSKTFKVQTAADKSEEIFYSVDLKRNIIKDKDIKYEILGVLNFLDRQRVVFVSQFNQEVGDRYLDITNNEALSNKDIRKSFGFYEIDEADSTKIHIQLTKWKDKRSLFLHYTLKQDALLLDSAFLRKPELDTSGKYTFPASNLSYLPQSQSNPLLKLDYKKREAIGDRAWRYDFIFDLHESGKSKKTYTILSLEPSGANLRVNMAGDTVIVPEIFWHQKK